MKKLFLLLATAAVTSGAYAEGYQVNNLSSKQNGMGHVGTAMKLNSESIWFNPAAASFQDSEFDISVGITGIASKATYTSLPDYTGKTKPQHYTSDNSIATPLYAYFNYKPLDWMSVGLAFNTPFGSSMDWGDNWPGAQLVQSINLQAYNLQPTVSFKLCEHLSIGGGLMMTWGKFDLSRSLLPIGADNPQNKALMGALQMLNPQMPDLFEMAGDKNLISLGLEGKAKMAVGVNLGVMWDINEQWSLGFTYRSKLKMKVDSGSIDLRMIDNTQIAQVIGQLLPQLGRDPAKLTSAVVKTELPLPASLTWGVSFRPVPKWEFAVDLQYVLWSAYDKLDVKILEPSSNTPVLNIPVSDKKYSNTLAFRFGGQYLRGYIFDCIFAGIHFSFSGFFCACRKSGLSFLHNILAIVLMRVPGVYVTSKLFPATLLPMGLATAAGSLLSVVICLIAFGIIRRKSTLVLVEE